MSEGTTATTDRQEISPSYPWRTWLEDHHDELLAMWEHLHTHAEISWEETNTTTFLAQALKRLGLRVTTFADGTGCVGEWGPETGPAVALRTDIDALWQEVDGEWRANHSCGHDGHMTTVFGAIQLLRRALPNPDVRIRVICQPAEETGEGAKRMVERGAVDDVTHLFGLHLRPIEELPLGKMSAAIYNGGADHVFGRIVGTAAHGARPHLGVNAIEVAFAVHQAVSGVHLNPMVPFSAKMTMLKAGGKSANIIPDVAEFSFDLRAQTNEAMDLLLAEVERRISEVCRLYGAEVSLERGARIMAAEVHPEAHDILEEAIVASAGRDVLAADVVSPGAEDFHYYTTLRPNLKATMLGLGCNLAPGLHHPQMSFEREALFDGMAALAEAVVRAIH